MSPEARRAVLQEAVRPVKLDGMFVFVDSIQLGRREADDERLLALNAPFRDRRHCLPLYSFKICSSVEITLEMFYFLYF